MTVRYEAARVRLLQGFWTKMPPTNVPHPFKKLVDSFDDPLPLRLKSFSNCVDSCRHGIRRIHHPVTQAFLNGRIDQLEEEGKGILFLPIQTAKINVDFTIPKAVQHFDVNGL